MYNYLPINNEKRFLHLILSSTLHKTAIELLQNWFESKGHCKCI